MNSPQAGSSRKRRFRIAVRRYRPFEKAIEAQWNAFEAQAHTGLQLDLVALDLHPLEEALFASGGMANDDWDAAFVATDWVSAMSELSCAVDLAPLLTSDSPQDWPHGWTPSLLRLQTIDNTILGVPYHDGPECLVYRRDLFDDPGLRQRFHQTFHRELSSPKTWSEFHETARFFQGAREGLAGTAFAAFPDGHNSVYDFLLQLWTRGGELLDSNENLQFETPEAEAALTFYRNILSDKAAVHPDCLKLDSVQLGMRFAAGEIAMMVNWFGFASMAHTSDDSAVRGLIDIAALPADEPGRSVSLNVYWLLSLPTGSQHRDIAWQFLRHTLSPSMDLLTAQSGAIGCRKSTWIDAEVNKQIPFYRRMEELHQVAREIPQRKDWPEIARTIDKLVTQTVTTSTPIQRLLSDAQQAREM